MQLLRSPWSEAFDDFGRAIRSQAILMAPFVQANPLEKLREMLNPNYAPRIDLITNLEASSLVRGMVDTKAITEFVRELSTREVVVTVWSWSDLHAKTYVADESLAIVTSGNLTWRSLNDNYEYGVKITKPVLVRQVIADIQERSSSNAPVPIPRLAEISDWARQAQSEIEASRRSEITAVRELQEKLDTVLPNSWRRMSENESTAILPELQPKPGETPHSVFTRAILHILQEGPLPNQQGTLTTTETYDSISRMYPELCNNSVIKVHRHSGFTEPLWRYQVRTAQEHLKQRGVIDRVGGRGSKWRLTE